MPSFIRKVKTKSGATAVQIVYKHGREVVRIVHIGSAHNNTELKILLALAHEKMHEGQLSFNFPHKKSLELCLEKSYSGLLWDTLSHVYGSIGFDVITDPVFRQLVLARIVEPTSKLDTIRVLGGLGLEAPSNSSIHRCLRRVIYDGYRVILSQACYRHVAPSSLRLVLYDVTALYFEVQKDDEYRKPGLSKERRLEP